MTEKKTQEREYIDNGVAMNYYEILSLGNSIGGQGFFLFEKDGQQLVGDLDSIPSLLDDGWRIVKT